MKIKKIAELFKKEENIVVYLTSDGPWIGTRSAMYFTPELDGISEADKDEPMDKMTLRLKSGTEIIPLLGFGIGWKR